MERTFYPSRNASPGSALRVDGMAQLTENEFPTSLCSLPINRFPAPPPFRCRRYREAEGRRAAFQLLFFPSRNTPKNMRPEGPGQAFFAAAFYSSQNPTERYLNILYARFYISTNLQLYKLPKSSMGCNEDRIYKCRFLQKMFGFLKIWHYICVSVQKECAFSYLWVKLFVFRTTREASGKRRR